MRDRVKRGDRQTSLTHGDYPCPICRHGQITTMPMMEALACGFCRHIFTLDLEEQVLKVEDSPQPLRWRWLGRSWQPVRYGREDMATALVVVLVLLAIVPPTLVALARAIFPPLPDSPGSGLGLWWIGLTALSHWLLVAWIVFEQYQPRWYVSLKVQSQDWFDRRS